MTSASVAAQLGISCVQGELFTNCSDSSVNKEPKSQKVVVDISGVNQVIKFRFRQICTTESFGLKTMEERNP